MPKDMQPWEYAAYKAAIEYMKTLDQQPLPPMQPLPLNVHEAHRIIKNWRTPIHRAMRTK
jgi:hypothetical protein